MPTKLPDISCRRQGKRNFRVFCFFLFFFSPPRGESESFEPLFQNPKKFLELLIDFRPKLQLPLIVLVLGCTRTRVRLKKTVSVYPATNSILSYRTVDANSIELTFSGEKQQSSFLGLNSSIVNSVFLQRR